MAESGVDGEHEGLTNVWFRWAGRREVPFHRYCPLVPSREPDGEGEMPRFRFVTGLPRAVLRHTPLVVLVAAVLYVPVQPAWPPATPGFAAPSAASLGLMALLVLWLAALVAILRTVDLFPEQGPGSPLLVYGALAVLGTGTLLKVTVRAAATPAIPERTAAFLVQYPFDFLLLLLLGGLLVYDGALRTETTFGRLHEKTGMVTDAGAYETFLGELRRALDHRLGADREDPRFGRPRARRVFAGLFLAPFLLAWSLDAVAEAETVAGLAGRAVSILLGAALDFVLVVVFFQFLVLIAWFNQLLAEHGPDDDGPFTLSYDADHPDGYAGFRDFGRFATRVNLLLLVGGGYLASVTYVTGVPDYPGLSPVFPALQWGVRFVGPIAVYALAVLVWLYLSFWQVHKAMRRGRELEMKERAGEGADLMRDLKSAPVWPVNHTLLVSLLSLDMLPLLGLLPFVPM